MKPMTDETSAPAAAPVPPPVTPLLSPPHAALADAVREIERHVAGAGWGICRGLPGWWPGRRR